MVLFDLWGESFIFAAIYSVIILLPCVIIALMGRKLIEKLGRYPSKAPPIQMSIFLPFMTVFVITSALLLGFFQFFTSVR